MEDCGCGSLKSQREWGYLRVIHEAEHRMMHLLLSHGGENGIHKGDGARAGRGGGAS